MTVAAEWDADTPCITCGHTASAHLGGDLGGECLRRPGGRFCACPAYEPRCGSCGKPNDTREAAA